MRVFYIYTLTQRPLRLRDTTMRGAYERYVRMFPDMVVTSVREGA
jgi:hypothetical protein